MKFDIDVLIVYADSDNKNNPAEGVAWVSQFKKFLELMLMQVLGEKPNIILKGEHDTITSPKLDNAAVLVPILSTEFNSSGQCLDHIEAFYKAIEASKKSRTILLNVLRI